MAATATAARTLIRVGSSEHDDDAVIGEPFVVTSYNVLADAYASFQQRPADLLPWARRLPLVDARVGDIADADMVCVQELDMYETLCARMAARGFSMSCFSKRPGPLDGCALFVRPERFAVQEHFTLSFNDITGMGFARKIVGTTYGALAKLRTCNIALVAVVRDRMGPEDCPPLVVVVPHLHWNPQLTHVKLLQAARLVMVATRTAQRYGTPYVIFGGDFNSLPTSAVYQWLTTGSVEPQHPDVATFCPRFRCVHELGLASAYAPLGEPATNFTGDFTGCIDYLMYTKASLAVTDVLAPQNPKVPDTDAPLLLPDAHNPSDHVPIAARFVRLRAPPLESKCDIG
jgi:CCR4-NOT transcription complex subunit 6